MSLIRNAEVSAKPNVLVTDDVEANLKSFDALLSDLECNVVLARSGHEALRQLLKREFAVILLDVQMPEMDGYEVARHVRMHPATREVPIIFATATHGGNENILKGYDSGAVDFLLKPIDPEVVRSKVKVFLELYLGRRAIADAKRELERKNADLAAAYTELQDTQAQLIQSAKMASLGQLVAGVAHEINNPLAFVVSHLGTALRGLEGVDQVLPAESVVLQGFQRAQSRLQEMDIGLNRIKDLVLKLKTFSRLDEGERKVVSVRESIDAILTILGHQLKDRIEVTLQFGDPDLISCYAGALNQALMNLVSNAIDAIQGEGKLWITTSAQGETFQIVIADTGPGIPAAIHDRIFEPFFTTKPIGEGTGLGLSITYSIVKKHGGTLQLRDRLGGGTEAVVTLPLQA
jgi:two-component system NtrC family sensor kinase